MGARVGARARRDDTRRREANANGERSIGSDRIGSRASERRIERWTNERTNERTNDVDVDVSSRDF
jgi:hypothetical protein